MGRRCCKRQCQGTRGTAGSFSRVPRCGEIASTQSTKCSGEAEGVGMTVNERCFVALDQLCDLVTIQRNPGDVPEATYLGLEHLVSGRMRPVAEGRATEVQSHKFAFQRN